MAPAPVQNGTRRSHEIRPDHLEAASARRVHGRSLPRAHRPGPGGPRRRLRPHRDGAALPLGAVSGGAVAALAGAAGRRGGRPCGSAPLCSCCRCSIRSTSPSKSRRSTSSPRGASSSARGSATATTSTRPSASSAQASACRASSRACEVIKRLWTEDEVTHHGRFFHLTSARLTLKPVQKPHPPIWFAANSDGPSSAPRAWPTPGSSTRTPARHAAAADGHLPEGARRRASPSRPSCPSSRSSTSRPTASRPSRVPALPRGEVQGLRVLGPGQGAARGRQLRPRVRGAGARPLHHRRPGRRIRELRATPTPST